MKVGFHLHSKYSKDSLLDLEKIAQIAEKNKIEVVILADHNNLVPEKEIEKIKKIRIIPGEEIKTKEGEIIGIFLKEKIEMGLGVKETIKKIKEQKGLVIVPHPFDPFRKNRLKEKSLFENIDQIDIIEIFNSRTILNFAHKKAEEIAKKYNKLTIVGSDAHTQFEIDKAIIEMDDFSDQFDFLEKLKEAKFFTKKTSIFIQSVVIFNKFFKLIL
jgi:predicted metal-dependent phosphoesterase TrpH